ncbi:MAG: hypothetical protein M1832_003825 [Thelocarpon impressellum]|nr:MAG: hypothetical protein M1832_003825 [Thelocarpon impressellum]
MAFIFTMIGSSRNPNPLASHPPEMQPQMAPAVQESPAGGRLSVIMEHGDSELAAPAPVKASHRPFAQRFQIGNPPGFRHDSPPPAYSPFSGVVGPNGEKLSDIRHNKHLVKRGGLWRFCGLALVVIMITVGLAVGLAVGLRKRSSPEAAAAPQNATATAAPAPPGPFPIGSYSMVTFLDSVATNCTSEPDAWRCYPYSTYEESGINSAATFNWIIEAAKESASSSSNFTISSSNNPFALTFSDIPLQMLDAGLSSERYRFQVPMDKVVVPSSPITNDNSRATCWFNGTTLQAELFTKREKSFPPVSASELGSADKAYKAWPFAIEIEQVIAGGEDVPQCFKVVNGNIGDRVPGLKPVGLDDVCSCNYRNWNRK